MYDIDDEVLEHIADLIKQGYTSGVDPVWSITIERSPIICPYCSREDTELFTILPDGTKIMKCNACNTTFNK